MKYLALLYLLGLVFVYDGLSEVADYSLSIAGPPPMDGLPELTYGSTNQPGFARREVLDAKGAERNLLYQFHLPPGIYDHLRWTGHGVPLPASVAVRDYWGRDVAVLQTSENGATVFLTAPDGPLRLPDVDALSLLRWLSETLGPWALLVVLFLLGREPLTAGMRSFLETSEGRSRLGRSNGRTMLLTCVALSAVWLALLIPGAVRFDVGDDPAMEMLSSGYVTGQPSEYLVFINVLLGLALKGLYLIVPQIPWYPLLSLTVTILCLAGITFLLLQNAPADRFVWLCLFGAVFGAYFVTHLQFTVTGFLLGLLGLLIFTQTTSRLSLVLAAALVVTGSLVRFESLLLLLATTALSAWLLSRRSRTEKVVFFAAILLLGWGGKELDQAYYDRDAGWRSYRRIVGLEGGLLMTPQLNFGEKNRPFYEHVGWSKNDFEMFNRDWLDEDAAAFSEEKLAYLAHHLTDDRRSVDVLFCLLVAIALAPAPTLLFVTMVLHGKDEPKVSSLRLAALVGPTLLILLDLAINARIPERVFVPAIYAASLFCLIARREGGEAGPRPGSTRALPVLGLTLIVLSLASLWTGAEENNRTTKRIVAALQRLVPYSHQTFIGSINAVRLEKLEPLTALAEARQVNIIHLMWSGGSPSLTQQLRRNGSTDLFQSIAFDPHFWLIIPTSQWDRAESFSVYMRQHYHRNITMTPVVLDDGKTAVFPDFTVMKAVAAGPP